jgi:hypothetical protein
MTFINYSIYSFNSDIGDMVFIYNNDETKKITLNVYANYPDYRAVNKKLHYVSLTTKELVALPDASTRMPSLRNPTFGFINDPDTGEVFRPATQIDFDLFDYKYNRYPNGDLTDNGKIYSYLLEEYQTAYMN